MEWIITEPPTVTAEGASTGVGGRVSREPARLRHIIPPLISDHTNKYHAIHGQKLGNFEREERKKNTSNPAVNEKASGKSAEPQLLDAATSIKIGSRV